MPVSTHKLVPFLMASLLCTACGVGGYDSEDAIGVWDCTTSNPNGTRSDSVYTFRADSKLYLDSDGYLISGTYSTEPGSYWSVRFTYLKSVSYRSSIDYDGELVVKELTSNKFLFDMTTHAAQTNTRGNVCKKR
jgi:hypothetical protein